MLKNKKIIFSVIFIGIILIFLFFLFIPKSEESLGIQNTGGISGIEIKSDLSLDTNSKVKEDSSIELIVGEDSKKISFTTGDTLEKILFDTQEKGQIQISVKEYRGLGIFITEIDSLKQGEGKNLFYYINGKEASVGVSSYKPQDGDIIEWRLK